VAPNRGRRSGLTPDEARAWIRIGRDIALVFAGLFLIVYGAAFITPPSALVIGGGLVALGLPPALRLDEVVGNGAAKK